MVFLKDPDAVLDYLIKWGDWLEDGETISTQTLIAPSGITVDSSAITEAGKSITVWLSGGTAGNNYQFTSRVTTSAARTDDRSFVVNVRER